MVHQQRLQSAMDYLMTYSIAILIIAIVIGIFYYLGVFGSTAAFPSVCIPSTGYLCASPMLNSAGNLNVTLGQASGTQITVTGTACTNTTSTPSNIISTYVVVPSQSQTAFTFQCPAVGNAIGKSYRGYLWLVYNTQTQTGLMARAASFTTSVTSIGSSNINVVVTLCSGAKESGSTSLTDNSVCSLYFCVGSNYDTYMTAISWSKDAVSQSSSNMWSATGSQPSNTCSVTLASNSYISDQAIDILGFNGISTYSIINSPTSLYQSSFNSVYSLTSTSNAVVLVGCGDSSCSTLKVPKTCTEEEYESGSVGTSEIAFCPSQPAGNYLINTTSGDFESVEVALLSGSYATVNVVPTLTFSNGTSSLTGSVDILTASVSLWLPQDKAEIKYCSGINCSPSNILVSGIGSVTYDTNDLTAGPYSFEACDVNENTCGQAMSANIIVNSTLFCGASGTANSLTLSMNSSCSLYFCAGSIYDTTMKSTSWNDDVVSDTQSNMYSATGSQDSDTCSVTLSSNSYIEYQTLSIIGFNGVSSYNLINSPSSMVEGNSVYSLTSTSNDVIIVGCGAGGEGCSGLKVPKACIPQTYEYVTGSGSEIVFCPSQPAGNYLVNVTGGGWDSIEVALLTGSYATVNVVPALTFSNGTSPLTGSIDILNASVSPWLPQDKAEIKYCSGINCSPSNVLVSGIGSVTYDTNDLTAGPYYFEACDVNENTCGQAMSANIIVNSTLFCGASGTANSLTLSMNSSCSLYFCAGSNWETTMKSTSWNDDVVSDTQSNMYSATGSQDSDTCSVTLASNSYIEYQTLSIIGFNGISSYSLINSPSSMVEGNSVYSLTSTSNDVIIVGCGAGGSGCSGLKVPKTCIPQTYEYVTGSGSEIAFCPSQPAGNYLINATSGGWDSIEVALLTGSYATVNVVPALTFSNGTSPLTGSIDILNASVSPWLPQDKAEIKYCSGINCSPSNILVSGIGSVTYDTNGLTAGPYSFEACDVNENTCGQETSANVIVNSTLLCGTSETTNSLTLSMSSGCSLYFCVGSSYDTTMRSTSWSDDAVSDTQSNMYSATGSQDSDTCSVTLASNSYIEYQTLSIIGFNGISSYSLINSPNSMVNGNSIYSLAYTSNTAILVGCGAGGSGCSDVKVPKTCIPQTYEYVTGSGSEIAFCPSQPAGNYLVNVTGGGWDSIEVADLT